MTSDPPNDRVDLSATEVAAEAFGAGECPCPLPIRRGRPSVADAEQLSGKILEASWQVLLDAGFDHFTFDRVARHAHIGKATIYSRFSSKHHLLCALLERSVEQRRAFILAQGTDLPVVQAFSVRAAEILKQLNCPDGMLMERLIDWLDQESGTGEAGDERPVTRGRAYRHAVQSIAQSLRESNERGETAITDVVQAAGFWLEGILGHSRMAQSEGPEAEAEIERWAQRYAEFFFAGVKVLSPPEASA